MNKYICVAKCPELDRNKDKHCIFTESYLDYKREYCLEICPCGNNEDLKIIVEGEDK